MVLPLRFSSFLLVFCLSLPCPHPPFMNSFSPNPQQWFQPCLSSCPPPHPLVTANCAPFLDWHCFPRGRRTAVMIGGSNVLTIFLEHKHCHSVWKATLIEHRFVQAAYWMDFPCAWLVLQLILAIDWIWTIVITLANICFPRCHPPLDLETEDLAVHQHCRSSNCEHQQSYTESSAGLFTHGMGWKGFHGLDIYFRCLLHGGSSAAYTALWGCGLCQGWGQDC